MHTLPLAAWAALVGLVGAGAPADVATPACDAPTCHSVSHGFVMGPPLLAVQSGTAVEWRGNGHHWFVESGTGGGCLSFKLSPDRSSYRLLFVVEDDELYAVHALPDGETQVLPCTGAITLPNGMIALRYSCALHAREGGLGLLLVTAAA